MGECQLNSIDIESVKGAIRLIDYYEDSYKRIQAVTDSCIVRGKPDDLLDMLGDTFSSKDAEIAGLSLGISRRTVYNQLDRLCKSPAPSIIRLKQGLYLKKVHDCTNAQCTNAQSEQSKDDTNEADTIVQSAEVQSASDAQKGGTDE